MQDYADIDIYAGLGVTVRELPLTTGAADYLLYADGKALGLVEAKPEGHTLTGVETQSAKYTDGLPKNVPAHSLPLPFRVKHPSWELPRLFVRVKMLAGCRTLDLRRLRTTNLGSDVLTLTAKATKPRQARTVPLPADVAADLRRLAGPVWLWERSLEESKRHRPNPRTKSKTRYDPSTWRWTIQNLFREFNRERPGQSRLRPHDLRARAITVLASATQSVDATARATGVDPQTARHYLDVGRAFDGSGILKQAADLLRLQE